MTILGLIEMLILLCVAIYAIRAVFTDPPTQRIIIGLVVLVFVLWLLEGAAVFGPSFHQPLFRRG